MLDNLKYIHQRDGQDALGVAERQWQQLQHKFELNIDALNPHNIENIILAGMGGSAWPALFMQNWPNLKRPFEIVRSYHIPKYVNNKTLFISSSYSGDTEEALSALAEAEASDAQIVILSSGGDLGEIARQKSYPFLQVPSGVQPRMSTFYFLAALSQLFDALSLIDSGKVQELPEAGVWLKTQVEKWRPDVATKDNQAKQIAQELAGKSVIIYSGPLLAPAANKWKICINENAKNLAWFSQYSEFNHNEFIGWDSHPINKPFAVVEIRSSLEDDVIQKRFELTERLLSGKRPTPLVVKPEGQSLLQQLVWASNLGDFVSIYLALLNNVNPTPVDLVEKFKTELNK